MDFETFCLGLAAEHQASAHERYALYCIDVHQRRAAELKRLREKPIPSEAEQLQALAELGRRTIANMKPVR
jgi:cytochrome c-type biogenesis protein CcmH/NrfG